MKIGESERLRVVRVPQAYRAAQRNLTHQQVVHPPECKLNKFNIVPDQMLVEVVVNALD